ncbi:hypothetical protein [Thalassomonas sp. RHCl1]|uniref:hypothetical protein n=1 Tax=Thalassomonas sp. RHCl1 TaxID=2995320 RepID=UPI00248C576B|nr:hypothetical protein [Thalassomonas sp. RHCl1]
MENVILDGSAKNTLKSQHHCLKPANKNQVNDFCFYFLSFARQSNSTRAAFCSWWEGKNTWIYFPVIRKNSWNLEK